MRAKTNPTRPENIAQFVARLDDPDELTRQRARLVLAAIGEAAIPALFTALSESFEAAPSERARQEAARVLAHIGTPSAAQALVNVLEDDNQDLRRAAVNGLVAIRRPAVLPLLEALVIRFSSPRLRQATYSVLQALGERGKLTLAENKVCDALNGQFLENEAFLIIWLTLITSRQGAGAENTSFVGN